MGSAAIPTADKARRAERRAVSGSARMRPNDWSSVEVGMLDLSEDGFRARCEIRLRAGSGVSIEVPGVGSVEAQVEWQRGGEFGARFYQPIDLSACAWTLDERHNALAHLLVARAGAKAANRSAAEAQLRRRILNSLPMRKTVVTG
ncbi:MAG TPA: PilZ domain-containing protein [Allosphingosinicella sp.]